MDLPIIEAWLQEASLPEHFPKHFDREGFLTVTLDGAPLTLSFDEKAETLFLYSTILRLPTDLPAAFLRELLILQTEARLPFGMMFGVSEEGLVIFGRYPLRNLDSTIFESLMKELILVVGTLPRELQDIYQVLLPKETVVPSEIAPAGSAVTSDLDDEALLRQQLMQSVRL